MRLKRSTITIALVPPAHGQYRLYGSVTGIVRRGRCVATSICVSVFEAVLPTYSVLMSQDGKTWCGTTPTEKWSMIFIVVGSITSTLDAWLLGTYTRGRMPARRGRTFPLSVEA